MICPNCGSELSDDARFCHHCGYDFKAEAAVSPTETPTGRKKMKKSVIIGICAGAVALIVLAAILLAGLFSGPEGKVLQAAAKSIQAYQEAYAFLPAPQSPEEPAPAHHSMALTLEELPQLPMVEGIGLELDVDADVAGRMLDMTLAPSLGSACFLETKLRLDGTTLYAAIPELLGERIYSADTTKMAQTLQNLGAELDEDLSGFGFDLFEVLNILRTAGKTDSAALTKAAAELGKALTAQKLGKETLTVNGAEKVCENYLLTIPQQALADFMDALAAQEAYTLADRLAQATGLPALSQEDLSEEDLHDVLEKLGDIRLEIAICDGYIARVFCEIAYEDDVRGINLSLDAQFGGKGSYADDFSVLFNAGEDGNLTILSSGDHTRSGGVFTDTTTFLVDGETVLESQLSYAPQGTEDNFSWTVTADGATLDMAGQIQLEDGGICAQLERVALSDGDEAFITLSLQLSRSDYISPEPLTGDIFDLTTATAQQLGEEGTALGETLVGWLVGLLSESSPLSDLVTSFLGI